LEWIGFLTGMADLAGIRKYTCEYFQRPAFPVPNNQRGAIHMVRNSAVPVVLVKRELPEPQEAMEQITGKVPASHKRRVESLAASTGYSVSSLVRMAVSHFLSTVTINKEEPNK
jgi:hypothetical protein